MNGPDATRTHELVARLRRPVTRGNLIRDLNPVDTLIMLVSLVVISIAPGGIVPLLAITLLYIITAFAARTGRKFTATYGKLYAVVGIILFVLRAIFIDSGTRLLSLGPFVVTTGGLLQALHFTLLVMVLCGALVLFFTLTTVRDFMLAMEQKGVTSRASYIALASFQAMSDLARNARVVMDAQRSRGIETEGSLPTRIRALVPMLIPVFLAAIEQTDERSLALDARAFNSRRRHTHLRRLRQVPVGEVVLTSCLPLLAALSVIAAVTPWH